MLDRIDEALARIERAASSPRAPDAALRERHERLKSRVAETLGELDALIESQRP